MRKNNEYKYLRFENHERNKKNWYVDIFNNDDDEWIGCIQIEKKEKDYDFILDQVVIDKRDQITDIEKFIMNWNIKKQVRETGVRNRGQTRTAGAVTVSDPGRGSRRLTPGEGKN